MAVPAPAGSLPGGPCQLRRHPWPAPRSASCSPLRTPWTGSGRGCHRCWPRSRSSRTSPGASPAGGDLGPGGMRGAGRRPLIHRDRGMGRRRGPAGPLHLRWSAH